MVHGLAACGSPSRAPSRTRRRLSNLRRIYVAHARPNGPPVKERRKHGKNQKQWRPRPFPALPCRPSYREGDLELPERRRLGTHGRHVLRRSAAFGSGIFFITAPFRCFRVGFYFSFHLTVSLHFLRGLKEKYREAFSHFRFFLAPAPGQYSCRISAALKKVCRFPCTVSPQFHGFFFSCLTSTPMLGEAATGAFLSDPVQ